MITAQNYIVMDGSAPFVHITLDPENTVDKPQLFLLEQDDVVIYVTNKILEDLVMAAHRLNAGQIARKQEYKKDQQ